MNVSNEPVLWITGRRSDDADPGGRVVAVVYESMPQPDGGQVTRVRCPFLHSAFMPVVGTDDAQCQELAIMLVLSLFEYRGVTDAAVSVVPPDDVAC
jgi:hypothetical protein